MGDKWYYDFYAKNPNAKNNYFTDNEMMLLSLDEDTRTRLLDRNNRKTQPILVIIDGVNGVGKSTVISNIKRKLESQGIRVRFNTFNRKRQNEELFKIPTVKNEWKFEREVVEQINRRLVMYVNKDVILVDKSPYCEYFYQKVKCFDRKLIKLYGNSRWTKRSLNIRL